jgi:hypothetical protein
MHCPLFSPDGRFALAQYESELFKIAIDGSQPPQKLVLPVTDVGRLRPTRWLTDDKVVIIGSRNSDLAIFDLSTGELGPMASKLSRKAGLTWLAGAAWRSEFVLRSIVKELKRLDISPSDGSR